MRIKRPRACIPVRCTGPHGVLPRRLPGTYVPLSLYRKGFIMVYVILITAAVALALLALVLMSDRPSRRGR